MPKPGLPEYRNRRRPSGRAIWGGSGFHFESEASVTKGSSTRFRPGRVFANQRDAAITLPALRVSTRRRNSVQAMRWMLRRTFLPSQPYHSVQSRMAGMPRALQPLRIDQVACPAWL